MRLLIVLVVGKTVRRLARLRGRGGSALPGVVAERLMPSFIGVMLRNLPEGVVVVTGTNGKTSTTKMITEVLRSSGKRVLTNETGSNFTRGIAAAIIAHAQVWRVRLPYDIAVLELDEAYASSFVRYVKPAYVVALNIMRDQLDRFGEIDYTAKLLDVVLQAATKGVVVNGDDPGLSAIGNSLRVPVQYFGVSRKLRWQFPADDELLAIRQPQRSRPYFAVELLSYQERKVWYRIGDKNFTQINHVPSILYNLQNGAASLAVCRLLLPDVAPKILLRRLATVRPAFGRGETIQFDGRQVEVILVKNPAGFRQALQSFMAPALTMIAINDNYADGRDISWLWDVDFSVLDDVAIVSGTRAYDMALRLQYDNVTALKVDANLRRALNYFLHINGTQPLRIFCTYTAMIAVRSYLGSYANVGQLV